MNMNPELYIVQEPQSTFCKDVGGKFNCLQVIIGARKNYFFEIQLAFKLRYADVLEEVPEQSILEIATALEDRVIRQNKYCTINFRITEVSSHKKHPFKVEIIPHYVSSRSSEQSFQPIQTREIEVFSKVPKKKKNRCESDAPTPMDHTELLLNTIEKLSDLQNNKWTLFGVDVDGKGYFFPDNPNSTVDIILQLFGRIENLHFLESDYPTGKEAVRGIKYCFTTIQNLLQEIRWDDDPTIPGQFLLTNPNSRIDDILRMKDQCIYLLSQLDSSNSLKRIKQDPIDSEALPPTLQLESTLSDHYFESVLEVALEWGPESTD